LNLSFPTAASVTVTAPARLHLGFLDLNGGLGRRFGSLGLPIGVLRTRLTISLAERTEIVGPERERVRDYMEHMQRALGLDHAHRVAIDEAVPGHAGLGSGTQLALGVAAALRRLHGLPLDVAGDAVRLGRGARSGVGIGLFERGGLVVDGGRGPTSETAPIVARVPFPERWRVLVILDSERQGLHGMNEGQAFATLPAFPEQSAAHLCRLVLVQVLPALIEADVASFGAAIRDMQRVLGDYFAPMQGGSRFTSPRVGACMALLDRAGAHGVGQSSWGPTGFAFVDSPEEADRLARLARADPAGEGLDIRVASGLNHGAAVTARTTADAPQQP
jgi:beta-ribofuranosylaminobenzene 5'-phosphate synthase